MKRRACVWVVEVKDGDKWLSTVDIATKREHAMRAAHINRIAFPNDKYRVVKYELVER